MSDNCESAPSRGFLARLVASTHGTQEPEMPAGILPENGSENPTPITPMIPEAHVGEVAPSKESDIVFVINSKLVPKLNEWMRNQDTKFALQQAATGFFMDNIPLREEELQMVRNSIARGEPTPYYRAIGGAYEYYFAPLAIGCVVKVRNCATKDELDLSDYDSF